MVRKYNVRKHDLHLPDGRVVERRKHKKSYPNQDRFEPLSDNWAEAFNKKRLTETHPDSLKTARVVFIKPVKIWAKRPDKFDVFRLDCDQVPEYGKIPAAGWPYQIIKVKGKYYVANDNGKFNRYFPPRNVDKFSRYINKLDLKEDKSTGDLIPKQVDDYSRDELRKIAKEKGIKNYWKYDKKQLIKSIIGHFEKEQNLT